MNMTDLQTVFAAEFLRRIRSRAFVIGMAIGVVGILTFTKLPALIGNAFAGSSTIVLIGDETLTSPAEALLKSDYDIAAKLPAGTIVTQAVLRTNKAAAALTLSKTRQGITVAVDARDPSAMRRADIKRDLLPLQLSLATGKTTAQVNALTSIPITIKTIGSKFSNSNQAQQVKGIAYMLIFFLYILILLNSQLVTSSVAEEKTSRIAELLVASVDPATLLAGKILAGTAIAVVQMLIWIAAGVLTGGSPGTSQTADANAMFSLSQIFDVLTPLVIVAFLAFFVLGMLQLCTIFAALASLINRTEDLGSITGPLTIPVVGALFIAIAALGSPGAPWIVTCSFVPILSPFVMFARIAVSNVPAWQVVLALAINLGALYGIALFAGKVYRVGMLLYGRTPKLSQVWNVIRS